LALLGPYFVGPKTHTKVNGLWPDLGVSLS